MSSFRFRVEHTNQRGVRILLLCLKVTGSQSRKGKNGDPSLITVGSMITIWWGVRAWVWRRWHSKRKWGLKMYRTHYSKCFTCLNIFNLCSSSESLAIIMNFSNHRLPLSSYFTRFLLLPIPIMIIKDELCFSVWFTFIPQCEQHDVMFPSQPCILPLGILPLQCKQAWTI